MAQLRRSTKAAKTHEPLNHVFVDFENVPTVDLSLIANEPAEVTLLIGEKQRRLELRLVQQIHEYAPKVTLVEVGSSGRNALDLVLAWHLGKAAERFPQDPFFVVSKDKDFDPLLAHLRAQAVSVARVDGFSHLPFLGHRSAALKSSAARRSSAGVIAPPTTPELDLLLLPPEPAKTSPDAAFAKLVARLRLKTKALPGRRKTLLTYINGYYRNLLSEADLWAIAVKLQEGRLLQIDARGRVSYPEGSTTHKTVP